MRLTLTVSALALATAVASPAAAQTATAAAATEAPAMCPSELGKKAREALAGYNDAVTAGDAAKTASARAAAEAAVKTDAERCVLTQINLNVAVKASDNAGIAAAIDALAANPTSTKSQVAPMLLNSAKIKFNQKDYAGASAMLDRVVAANPTAGEAYILLAESRFKTGRQAEAPALALKAIAAEKAAGRKAPEAWYKHAVAMAFDTKNPQSVDLAREWVMAYPTSTNWRDALRILAMDSKLPENDLIDVYRLQMATKAMAGTADYARFANLSSKLGYPGETEAVIKAGIAANALSASNSEVSSMLKVATGKVGADKAGLAAATAKAIASGNAKSAMAQGDANYGYGNYAEAAKVYRAVAGMSGADVATANLRLGMALAMSGDKAGAETALKAVTGPKASLAQFWLAYANSRA